MIKKTVVLGMVMILAMSAVHVFASDESVNTACQIVNADESVEVPMFCDGRLNANDIAQSVAVYYTYDTVTATNDDGELYQTEVISGIAAWGINADKDGYLAFWASMDDIQTAMTQNGTTQIAAGMGYALYYDAEWDVLSVTAPDGYTFTWEV